MVSLDIVNYVLVKVTASYNLFVVPMLKLMYLTFQRPPGQRADSSGCFHYTYKVIPTLTY
jgi:hypothetical protein